MDYQPKFHSFESFPADPNRGIDIPPSYALFAVPSSSLSSSSPLPPTTTIRVYSNALLLMPPVPDLSMPFNIAGLTGTFYAFLIGTMLNMLLRKATTKMADEYKGIEHKSKMDKLKDKVKGLLQ